MKLASLVVLLLIHSALATDGPKKDFHEIEVPDEMNVAQRDNKFATELYARLRSGHPGNLFFSPFSVSTALAMPYAGANGPTRQEMAKVLHVSAPEQNFYYAHYVLQKRLSADDETPAFQLRIANRLWGRNDLGIHPPFAQFLRHVYGVGLVELDFQQTETARQTINSWVEKQTDRRIQELISPGVLSADTPLVLANAIYFKATWVQEFLPGNTQDAAFHVSAVQQIKVPTMFAEQNARYVGSLDIQVLELPYQGRSRLSMLILLPKSRDGLSDLENRLTSENLQKWTSGLRSRTVKVHLPRFKMTSEFRLTDMLAAMGMPLAFSEQADFSVMSAQKPLFISNVIHKAFVDVNEEGTEAAAVTALEATKSAPEEEESDRPVEFRADHPFLFLIRDNRTETILFLGRLLDPGT